MKKVIVAIDFGTSGTTYAFSFLDSKDDIILGKWNETPDAKNSTEIVLNDKFEIKKFGIECKKFFLEDKSSEEKYYHFSDIKMKLYENKNKITATNENITLDIDLIISKILQYIKQEAINHIKTNRPSIKESEIEWKVTIPAIWKNNSKEIMLNASKKAGIFNENENNQSLFFSLEPEAAACDYVNENSSDKNAIKPGNSYIVCDIGGGTIDISTHIRRNNNGQIYIEELYPPKGGNCGSTYINKSFWERVITKLFGKDAIEKLKKIINDPQQNENIYEDYCELLDDIEEFKKDISFDSQGNSKRINCSFFEELINEEISSLIRQYNDNYNSDWKINKNNGLRIYFPYQIMIDLTKEIIVDNTVKHINKILKNIPDIKSIIYAGSVSNNVYIFSMIKEEIKKTYPKLEHYRSTFPSTSIVKGAVIFGYNPFIIKSRISKYTIGVKCNEDWDQSIHGKRPELKFFDENEKKFYCRKIFTPIIHQKEKIGVDEKKKQYFLLRGGTSSITFYKTKFKNVKFIDETYLYMNIRRNKCIELFETLYDIEDIYDEKDRNLIIELQLGGTFVYGNIIYKGISKPVEFHFLKGN